MKSRLHARSVDGLSRVQARINYLVPMAERPVTYVDEAPPGVKQINAVYRPYDAWIYDARTVLKDLSLEREGFVLAHHTSAVQDFWDDRQVRDIYYAELQGLIQDLTGARAAFVFDHTRRKRSNDRFALDGNRPSFTKVREPVGKAHVDFTAASARTRFLLEMGDRAALFEGRRLAIINVWRPINPQPILDAPLAVLDAASCHEADLVSSDLVYKDRIGETYNLMHSPAHRWYYFPRQSRSEVIVFKNFDSDSPVNLCPHTAFDDPLTPVDAPLRESIEARVFAIF